MPARLPDPDERPSADVIIFDGECRFCRGQVERLARWDRGKNLAFLSLQDPRVGRRYPDLSPEELMEHMYLIDGEGKRHRGAEAVRYLSTRLPMLWILAPWLHLPYSLPLWQWCYRQVARRRYLWGKASSCDDGTCSLHQ